MKPSSTSLRLVLVAAGLVLTAGRAAAGTGDENLDAATKARIERFEKGPKTIDVSNYPAPIRQRYQVFAAKCTLCHALSRPINSDFVLPDEWSRYVKRMMHKPGSNITPTSAKQIYEFLAYDSSVRKKAMLDAKLAQVSPAERAEAEAKIKALHQEFDGK